MWPISEGATQGGSVHVVMSKWDKTRGVCSDEKVGSSL